MSLRLRLGLRLRLRTGNGYPKNPHAPFQCHAVKNKNTASANMETAFPARKPSGEYSTRNK